MKKFVSFVITSILIFSGCDICHALDTDTTFVKLDSSSMSVSDKQYEGYLALDTLVFGCTQKSRVYDTIYSGPGATGMSTTLFERWSVPYTTSIGKKAFYNCPNLKKVTILEAVDHIGEYAFGYIDHDMTEDYPYPIQVNDFTIHGYIGTEAERYARENNLKFFAMKTTERGVRGRTDVILENTDDILYTPGDINSDGSVTVEDAQLALREYVDNMSKGIEGRATVATDVNADNRYDISDVQYILKYYTYNSVARVERGISWYEVRFLLP